MHFNAVGRDCPGKTELHRGVLEAASMFVEFEPQTRIEGDLQQMPADFAVTELWRVLAGLAPGRRAADQVTVFDSVGFALEDHSALTWMGKVAADRASVPRSNWCRGRTTRRNCSMCRTVRTVRMARRQPCRADQLPQR